MLCGGRRGGPGRSGLRAEAEGHPAARTTPERVGTLFSSSLSVWKTRLVSYQHINLSSVHSFKRYRLVRFLFKILKTAFPETFFREKQSYNFNI